MDWSDTRRLLKNARLPAALVASAGGKPIRVTSKSIRHVGLLKRILDLLGERASGLMACEGHIAGLPDASPFSPALNPVKALLKRRAFPAAAALRQQTVEALEASGVVLSVVNVGGTGSVHLNATETAINEVTAGSGFLCSHLLISDGQIVSREPTCRGMSWCFFSSLDTVEMTG